MEQAWGTRLRPKTDYKHARDGDHLMVPFECDLCIFRKLRGGNTPAVGSAQDNLLLACIRRISLDAFWSRASSTVKSNKDRIKSGLSLSNQLGLEGPYQFEGNTSGLDTTGYEIALQIVLASRKPGRHSTEYTQWDTIRKIRSAYAVFAKTTPQGSTHIAALADDKGRIERFVQDGTASYWFSRFLVGCKRRMGQDWRPNRAFSMPLLLELMKQVEIRIEVEKEVATKSRWVVFAAYIGITYTLSLRGSEGFLVDLKATRKNWEKGLPRYFIVALLGKVKGETNEREHLLPCSCITSSGIEVFKLVQRLLKLKEREGYKVGPAISNCEGKVYSTGAMDACLIDVLEDIYVKQPELFSIAAKEKDDLEVMYQVFRSFRRSSASRAIEMGVSSDDIDMVNRWNTTEKAQGNRPSRLMRHHYTQMENILEPFIRYTSAM